jgi:hypothetical protein
MMAFLNVRRNVKELDMYRNKFSSLKNLLAFFGLLLSVYTSAQPGKEKPVNDMLIPVHDLVIIRQHRTYWLILLPLYLPLKQECLPKR